MSAFGAVTAAASLGAESVIIRPKRMLGPLVAQVTIEEIHEDDLEITEHPVEQGAIIADHAFKRPARLRMHLRWSNSPSISAPFTGVVRGLEATVPTAQALITGNTENQVRDVYDKLLKLQEARVPFDVVTGKRSYADMLVRGIVATTNKEFEHTLDVVVNLHQLIMVSTRTIVASVPAARLADAQATLAPTNVGTVSPVPSTRFIDGQ